MPESNPEYGRMQPTKGIICALSSQLMGRPRKRVQPKGELEEQLGHQLRAWMAQSLKKYQGQTRQIDVLSKRSGVGKETIRQIMNGRQTARVNNLQAITAALGRTLTELFKEIETGPDPSPAVKLVDLDELHRNRG